MELAQQLGRRVTAVTEDTGEAIYSIYLLQQLSVALQRGNVVNFTQHFHAPPLPLLRVNVVVVKLL